MFDKFIEKQVNIGLIKTSDANIYKYGYILVFDAVINVVLGMTLGAFLKAIPVVALFWISYIPLRIYAGGWHANKGISCLIISNLVLIAVIYVVKNINMHPKNIVCFVVEVLTIIAIIYLSPVDTRNKRLIHEEKRKYRKLVVLIICVESLLSICCETFYKVCFVAYVIILLSLILQVMVEKKRYRSEIRRQR